MKTKKQLEKEVKIAEQVKFRNCLVCEKQYSVRQSTTKRYCSRRCSCVAERVRDWENKRGMNIRELKATLTQTNEIIEMIEEEIKECKIMLKKNPLNDYWLGREIVLQKIIRKIEGDGK